MLLIIPKIVRTPDELRQSLSTNRHISESQYAMHEDMQLYKTSCKLDLITRFIRPPEFMTIVDMVGKYYLWFNLSSKPLKDNLVIGFIDEDIKKSAWIDAMKCRIFLQKKALNELVLWLETIENEEDIYHRMVSLFFHLYHVTQSFENLNNTEQIFLDFASKHLFYENDDDEHLPIPVYSGIKPSMGP